jgi:hypothetical protein
MVIAETHETFPRLLYRISKNPRFLIANPVLGTCLTLYRKPKVIFGISSPSCIEPFICNSFSRKFWLTFTSKPDPKSYRSVYSKRYKGITSVRAQIFSRCSHICVLLMVIAKTHETFLRLVYKMSKNLRFLVGNPV